MVVLQTIEGPPAKTAVIPLHFVIIGGGITGLACALALRRTGYIVTVLEKEEGYSSKSEGCRIPPNLTKILYHLGLRRAFQSKAMKCNNVHLLRFESGEYLNSYLWSDDLFMETGGDLAFIQHAKLRDLLYEAVDFSGVDFRFNAEVVKIDPETAVVTLRSGEIVRGDVIVGADGLQGISLHYMGCSEIPVEDTGIEMFSMTVPREAMVDDLDVCLAAEADIGDMFIWMGNERSVLGFPTDGERSELSMSVYVSLGPKHQDTILQATETEFEYPRRIAPYSKSRRVTMRAVLTEWVRGRMVIIGEAAHPLPPGSLQSTALSIEDGVVLAKLFSHLTSVRQIDEFLVALQEIRQPRCEEIHTKEYGIVYFMTMPPSEEEEYRDGGLRARRDADMSYIDGDSDLGGSAEEKEFRDIFGYEATEEADSWWVDWGMTKERLEGKIPGRRLSTTNSNPIVVEVERSTTITVQQFRFWSFY
ncbi:FAD/NAD-P-binding domain-containing protein [Moniliophthora roreri MCA 2997]|uniref:FAD/NAD-P-binding domain-containing protein n=1 Tax=Moniliophthora roreri (strain MCA 2997) TaxID=1381753 RepID=V2WWB6_MONRO|nr:FAD/NAD-P-binding domain-containing protein [Moniliophthora roreri MCA 2997]